MFWNKRKFRICKLRVHIFAAAFVYLGNVQKVFKAHLCKRIYDEGEVRNNGAKYCIDKKFNKKI